jgi:hypothetical protein|tara:strand:- start:1437 stop:1706 length:270 start_codon:yes stop_codon:yes gene_type:complete
MKWVLVNREYEIVSKYEVNEKYGLEAAKFYFMGRKQLSEKRFDELWNVVSEKEYNLNQSAFERKSSSDPNKRWWAEDKYLDIDSSIAGE